ncbi:putative quinol monooxygenase [Psychromicrobium lacuslunae]|uniref:putative quinol monooxygenase n=1 Tax=Psychromicrobium lacuslunae TaxID=1618207 RepID=UPI000AE45A6B|nr:antibiotic biosynthesis monooxygenase [Psychromicrobium lacuslunae]
MTFAYFGKLGTQPGRRDEVVAILVRSDTGDPLPGCLLYEVGINPDFPDQVFVSELWESKEAHQASSQLPSVQVTIKAMPLLSGEMSGNDSR